MKRLSHSVPGLVGIGLLCLCALTAGECEAEELWFTPVNLGGGNYGALNHAATVDAQGNVIVTAYWWNLEWSDFRWVVFKVSTNGLLAWTVDLPATGISTSVLPVLTTSPGGDIYVAGGVWNADQEVHETHVYRLAPDGSTDWTRNLEEVVPRVNSLHLRDDGYLIVVGDAVDGYVPRGVGCAALYEETGITWWDTQIGEIDGYSVEGSLIYPINAELDGSNRLTVATNIQNQGLSATGVGWVRWLPNGIQDVSGTFIEADGSYTYYDGIGEFAGVDSSGRLTFIASHESEDDSEVVQVDEGGEIAWTNTITSNYNFRGTLLLHGNDPIAFYDRDDLVRSYSYNLAGQVIGTATGSTVHDYGYRIGLGPSGQAYVCGRSRNGSTYFTMSRLNRYVDEEWSQDFGWGPGDVSGEVTPGVRMLQFDGGSVVGMAVAEVAGHPEENAIVVFKLDDPSSAAREGDASAQPNELSLGSYPNPFNGTCTVQLDLPFRGSLSLSVVDLLGRTVMQQEHSLARGTHRLPLVLDGNPSGVYLLRASGPRGMVAEQRVTLVK